MKFITEEDLRDLYKKQPFTNYDLQPGERLTPGARQFLVDRGIDMYDRNDPFSKPAAAAKQETKAPSEGSGTGERKKKKYCSRMKSLQVLFLLTAEELLKKDILLSQQLTGLYRQFALLETAADGTCQGSDLCCSPCSGMNTENFSEDLGACFDVTEFHMQMEKGREMLLMARLRSELAELEADLEDFLPQGEACRQVSRRLNQIMNTLSQMICSALGGKECQRSI